MENREKSEGRVNYQHLLSKITIVILKIILRQLFSMRKSLKKLKRKKRNNLRNIFHLSSEEKNKEFSRFWSK